MHYITDYIEVNCPYCGECFTTAVDISIAEQQTYIEDCQICCYPITFLIQITAKMEIIVVVKRDDE